MHDYKALRFWKLAVTLLVLCNIALVSVIWLRPYMPFGPRPLQPRDFVIRTLNFSPGQVKKYDTLIQSHQQAMQQLRTQAAGYRKQLFNNLANEGPQNLNPDSLAQLIAANQKQIELATYRHFAAVRAICTEDQKAQFDKIIDDVTRMMNGGRGNHPPAGQQGPSQPGDHDAPPPPPAGNQQGPPPPDGPPPTAN